MSESPVKTAFGWLLVCLGGVWLLLTGGCTLYSVGSLVWNLVRFPDGDVVGGLLIILVVGGLCIAPGAGMFWLGRKMLKSKASG